MAESTENLTIKLLQEMREDIGSLRNEVQEMRTETQEGFSDVNTRIDGVMHLMSFLAGNAHNHEERLEKLETK